MERKTKILLEILDTLMASYGDLNTAYVAKYLEVWPRASISQVSRGTGLNRSVVRRAKMNLSESDTQK